jgi:hypothetical protein
VPYRGNLGHVNALQTDAAGDGRAPAAARRALRQDREQPQNPYISPDDLAVEVRTPLSEDPTDLGSGAVDDNDALAGD